MHYQPAQSQETSVWVGDQSPPKEQTELLGACSVSSNMQNVVDENVDFGVRPGLWF